MITTKNLALAFLLGAAVTGCAAQAVDEPSDPGDPNNPPVDPLPENVDAAGKYQIKSSIDLAQNAPGKAGEVARAIIDATDDADDPTSWILDQAINALPDGTIKDFASGAKPFIAGFLNDRLLEIAPDFVTTMITVGNDLGQAAKSFGLEETLEISGTAGNYTAIHTVRGARFEIDGVETPYLFSDYGTQDVVVSNVAMSVDPDSAKITLANHAVPLAYGQVLRIALDGAIIPSLDPSAQNLADLLQNQVDCQVVGEAIDDAVRDQIGFSPGVSVFRSACNLGLEKAADLIYNKLADIDGSVLELSLDGSARALDKDGDNRIDTIQTGTWAGTMSYAGTPADLTDATFFGTRM